MSCTDKTPNQDTEKREAEKIKKEISSLDSLTKAMERSKKIIDMKHQELDALLESIDN